jgi:1-acyl-sn-glycerol-3-phosphate acyltransferase
LKPIKTVLIFVWSLWCGIVFFGLLTIYLPIIILPPLLKNETLKRQTWQSLRYVAKLILILWGIKVEIRNKHLIDAQRQFVYVPNHRSYLDAMVVGSSIPNHVKYLGKAEILKWPILGFILKHYHIAVQRNDAGSRSLSLEQMNELVKSGASLCIFPEGTCNTTTSLLKKFHEGAFKIAVPNKIPIVPITVIGTGELMPRNGLMLRPGKIILYWHEPISTKDFKFEDIPMLVDKVKQTLIADLAQHYPNGYEA